MLYSASQLALLVQRGACLLLRGEEEPKDEPVVLARLARLGEIELDQPEVPRPTVWVGELRPGTGDTQSPDLPPASDVPLAAEGGWRWPCAASAGFNG